MCFLIYFFFYYTTLPERIRDISAESRAKSYGRIGQLVVSALLLFMGFGIIGAASVICLMTLC